MRASPRNRGKALGGFGEYDLGQVLGVLPAGNAPQQPMHAIMVRCIKRPKPVRSAWRIEMHN